MDFWEKKCSFFLIAVYITIFFSVFSLLRYYFEKNESRIEIEKKINSIYESVKIWIDDVVLMNRKDIKQFTHLNTRRFFESIQGTNLSHQIYKYLKIFVEIEENKDC